MAKVWITVFIGLAAIVDDLSRRRISNWIPIAACLAGLAVQIGERGWRGTYLSLLGALTGGAVFLIFYILGGMGGGDIKLMAGFGAILGAGGILEASLWTAGCGGLLAAAVILTNMLRRAWHRRRAGPTGDRADGDRAEGNGTQADSIPYAPAIAAGVWLSLVGKV